MAACFILVALPFAFAYTDKHITATRATLASLTRSTLHCSQAVVAKWRLDAKLAKGHTVENGLKEGLEEECKNNFAWDHVTIAGAPGHYRLYSNDHGKFVLDDMFPDWN